MASFLFPFPLSHGADTLSIIIICLRWQSLSLHSTHGGSFLLEIALLVSSPENYEVEMNRAIRCRKRKFFSRFRKVRLPRYTKEPVDTRLPNLPVESIPCGPFSGDYFVYEVHDI